LGLSQSEELAAFLKDRPLNGPEAEHIKIINGAKGAPPSKIISSDLRRAVSTIASGLKDRLNRRPSDKIVIVDCLQEISRNPDTLCITPAKTPIQASWIDKSYKECKLQDIFDQQTDMSLHEGNKPIRTNGLKRMLEFCEFVYSSNCEEDYIIVGGHSIWFRSFFRMFLPYSVHHISKNNKIQNCGVITFDLMRAETRQGQKYMIDPKTIKVVYGGYS